MIVLCAEPFAHALVETGDQYGIEEFLLVQWLAPLASEAPEFLVAGLLRLAPEDERGLGTLVSSKVNQWTLLVGTLPIVFAISSGSSHGLPIEAIQREELLLTAAQSLFAVAVIVNLSMSLREAGFLFGLFWIQFILGAIVPESMQAVERIGVGIVYLVLGTWVFVGDRGRLRHLFHDGFRASYDELAGERTVDERVTSRAEGPRSRPGMPVAWPGGPPRVPRRAHRRSRGGALARQRPRAPGTSAPAEPFPTDLPELLVPRLALLGIDGSLPAPGARARGAAAAASDVMLATGTASGKTLVYNDGVRGGRAHHARRPPRCTCSPRRHWRATSSAPSGRSRSRRSRPPSTTATRRRPSGR